MASMIAVGSKRTLESVTKGNKIPAKIMKKHLEGRLVDYDSDTSESNHEMITVRRLRAFNEPEGSKAESIVRRVRSPTVEPEIPIEIQLSEKFADIEKILSKTWSLLLKNSNEEVKRRLNLIDLQWIQNILEEKDEKSIKQSFKRKGHSILCEIAKQQIKSELSELNDKDKINEALSKIDEALEHLKESGNENKNSMLHLYKIDLLVKKGCYAEALRLLKQHLNKNPTDMLLRKKQVQCLCLFGLTRDAIEICQKWRHINVPYFRGLELRLCERYFWLEKMKSKPDELIPDEVCIKCVNADDVKIDSQFINDDEQKVLESPPLLPQQFASALQMIIEYRNVYHNCTKRFTLSSWFGDLKINFKESKIKDKFENKLRRSIEKQLSMQNNTERTTSTTKSPKKKKVPTATLR